MSIRKQFELIQADNDLNGAQRLNVLSDWNGFGNMVRVSNQWNGFSLMRAKTSLDTRRLPSLLGKSDLKNQSPE